MQRFKQIDLAISVLLILGFTLCYFFYDPGIVFTAYFVVGGWQVFSMLIHEIMSWFTYKNGIRRLYHWVTLIIIAMGGLGFVFPLFLFIYYIMLFAAPFMAITYTAICFAEIRRIPKRTSKEI